LLENPAVIGFFLKTDSDVTISVGFEIPAVIVPAKIVYFVLPLFQIISRFKFFGTSILLCI